jgi:hypothetical protein
VRGRELFTKANTVGIDKDQTALCHGILGAVPVTTYVLLLPPYSLLVLSAPSSFSSSSTMSFPVVGETRTHLPPAASIADTADDVNACALTVRPLTVSSAPPVTLTNFRFCFVMSPASLRASKVTIEFSSMPLRNSIFMSPYSVFLCPGPMGRPVNLGTRRYSGVWPPSNPGREGRPERDFCPRMPNPQEPPWPAASPRPLRFLRCLDPGAGRRLSRVKMPSPSSLAWSGSARFFQSNSLADGVARAGATRAADNRARDVAGSPHVAGRRPMYLTESAPAGTNAAILNCEWACITRPECKRVAGQTKPLCRRPWQQLNQGELEYRLAVKLTWRTLNTLGRLNAAIRKRED